MVLIFSTKIVNLLIIILLSIVTIISSFSSSSSLIVFVSAISACGNYSEQSGTVTVTTLPDPCSELVIENSTLTKIDILSQNQITEITIRNIVCELTGVGNCIAFSGSFMDNIQKITIENITHRVTSTATTGGYNTVSITSPITGSSGSAITNEISISGITLIVTNAVTSAGSIQLNAVVLGSAISNFNSLSISNLLIEFCFVFVAAD